MLYNITMPKIKTILKARYLRKFETESEKILWDKLRNNRTKMKFRRQHPVDMYILDFYSPKNKIAIEIDGPQHLKNRCYDKERTEYLKLKGIRVLRFQNYEIKNDLKNVLNKIKSYSV